MRTKWVCVVMLAVGFQAGCVSVPPLIRAASKGDIGSAKALLDNGADVNEWCYGTALFGASAVGHTEMVKLLIDKGANVNARSRSGDSALVQAARFGHADVAKILITHGADIDMALMGLETLAVEMDRAAIEYPSDPSFRKCAAEARRGCKMLERLQNEYFPLLQKVQLVPHPSTEPRPVPVVGEKETRTEQGDAAQKLLDAKRLLDANIITKEEYEAIKAKLLPSLLENTEK